jgi:hypothetical protein
MVPLNFKRIQSRNNKLVRDVWICLIAVFISTEEHIRKKHERIRYDLKLHWKILWHIDLLISGDSVNNIRCYATIEVLLDYNNENVVLYVVRAEML